MADSSNTPLDSGLSNPASAPLPNEALDLASRLFDFARAGDTKSLIEYLDNGIPPNLRTHDGNSFLMLAAYHGHLDCVQALLERGADANLENDRGQTPLAGVAFKGYFPIAKLLIDTGKAEIHAGTPNAVATATMFKRQDFLDLFNEQTT